MNHSPYPVVLDACVLYPSLLRDLLMRLGIKGLYQPKWTQTIQEEWQRHLLQNRPDITAEQITRTDALMNQAIPDAMVTGYENLIEGINLPDPDDRHVVAAAVRCNAEVIVTLNLKDFPASRMVDFDIESLHPDEFISDLFDLNHALALQAVAEQRNSMRKPARSVDEYLAALLRQGLPMTIKAMENYQSML
ncbi:PIN domain-containing protein [Erwinia sp. SLM-02]|uniref:PIN domain-containing protein n=1 Tax=Erwinia sp. SLM-02 TaxID=3020057 RepID=UPI0028D430ED|nr:PIN domain-containing protein [uncultured Erwinia sp.]